jgi:hypothetical protein
VKLGLVKKKEVYTVKGFIGHKVEGEIGSLKQFGKDTLKKNLFGKA